MVTHSHSRSPFTRCDPTTARAKHSFVACTRYSFHAHTLLCMHNPRLLRHTHRHPPPQCSSLPFLYNSLGATYSSLVSLSLSSSHNDKELLVFLSPDEFDSHRTSWSLVHNTLSHLCFISNSKQVISGVDQAITISGTYKLYCSSATSQRRPRSFSRSTNHL